jgi:hypothetical protein
MQVSSRRRVVIVGVGGRFMIRPLVFLALAFVRMHERRVVVLMHVVAGAVLEFAEHAAGVVVGHVVVVVGVNQRAMRMLVLDIPHNALDRR